jgi:hypothetical protein
VRAATFLERLMARVDCELDVCGAVARRLWPAALAGRTLAWRDLPCDVGVVQASELEVDRAATARALEAWEAGYDRRVEEEAARLAGRAAAVLVDVPPLAFDAAYRARVPAFALANFSWDWIYAHMGFEHSHQLAARAYGRARAVLAVEPAAPMPAFQRSIRLGTLGRVSVHDRHALRARLGVAPHERLVLLAFREAQTCALPPPALDVRYMRANGSDVRADVVGAPTGFEFIDLVAAADAVVAKAGYGIIGDTAACGTPLIYTHRSGFPEDAVLGEWLAARTSGARVDAERLRRGEWLDDLESVLSRQRPAPLDQSAVEHGTEALASVLTGRAGGAF